MFNILLIWSLLAGNIACTAMAFVTPSNVDDIEIIENIGDDLFLDLVKERPWIYNNTVKGYGDGIMTFNAWQDIGKIMNMTGKI